MLMMGDNVYGDLDAQGPDHLARAYADLASNPDFRAFVSQTPILATWDDHDFGANDGDSSYANSADAREQFLSFWKIPADDPRRARKRGLYHSELVGPPGRAVQIIMLDLRTFRTPLILGYDLHRNAPGYEVNLDPAQSLLGPDQWDWLERELTRPADVRILVSSLQLIGDGGENWKHTPLERRRLFELIAKTKADGVIVLSGDVHTGAMYRFDRNVRYPIYEITSSSLNQGPQPVMMDEAYLIEGGIYADSNFGLLEIDWVEGLVKVKLHALSGAPVRDLRLSISDLSVR
jgi:alkaline phosphatase D